MGAISAEALTWSVHRNRLLHGVDLDVTPGSVVGLLGPNGSGKTTLLRLLAGLRTPESGRVLLDGRDLTALSRGAIARRVAVMEQDSAATTGDLTVRQVVELGRIPHRGRFGGPSAEDPGIISAALSRVDLMHRSDAAWSTLSGGEKQRAQLARALAQEPTEILLDEPTNHLDIRHQIDLLELLQTLGITCVIALHDLNLAARYCDHVVVINGGKSMAAGPPDRVLTQELLRTVYGVDALIDRDPKTGTPRITFRGSIRE
ncbi:ABC transporter ATP-binding protein [Mycetocola tolaasinivorans]|uniref:ABC transporter ATP-binding protein n=1 Tax=Mycetocola tolaasinivorans TaxID=76635 RepID=A0A3L7A134_9MICO|nr:ABC transporter ATP-binding protein [Mycetocola tolaasinivorans]RLP73710.1 ABC transporter ATP-binding protein [Mycetocola tolaasinivorans]